MRSCDFQNSLYFVLILTFKEKHPIVGTLLAEYRILELLGAGGMGQVYRAVHSRLGRVVAVKVIAPQADAANSRARFVSEARIHATLRHPNIATLFEFVEAEGRFCLVMEYVDGQALDEILRANAASGNSVPLDQILKWFESVAQAVAYLHEKGVIHRDIKASNIKINSEGDVKLLDFGIARSAAQQAAGTRLTQSGGVIGTLEYLAPELLRGEDASPASDVWALGILLHEMLTGAVPFRASGIVSMHKAIEAAPPPRPSLLNASTPRALDDLVAHCLQKNPSERPTNARELAKLARRAQNQIEGRKENQAPIQNPVAPLEIASDSIPEKSAARPSRLIGARPTSRVLQALAGIIALASIAGGVFLWRGLAAPIEEKPVVEIPVENQAAPLQSENANGEENTELHEIKIEVAGGGAQVLRDGEMIGQTPLELREKVGARVVLTLRREGFREREVEFVVIRRKYAYLFVLQKSD